MHYDETFFIVSFIAIFEEEYAKASIKLGINSNN